MEDFVFHGKLTANVEIEEVGKIMWWKVEKKFVFDNSQIQSQLLFSEQSISMDDYMKMFRLKEVYAKKVDFSVYT